MKIAFLSHLDLNLYLFRLPIMQRLIEEGHEVYAICPKGEKFDAFSQFGIKAIAYDIERSSLNPLKEIKAIYNIYRAIKPLKLDILHTFTAKPNIYGTIAGKMAKVPTIINLVEGLGSFYIEESLKNRVVRTMIEKLYQIVFTFSNQVVFVNSDDPAYLQSKNIIATNKIIIIKSVGIDTEVFSPDKFDAEQLVALKRELGVEDKCIVLMVARAIWHKGIEEFYEAASLLEGDKSIQFILVGDVDKGNPSSVEKSYLETGAVLWLGHRDDIASLTAMSDIYVLPSYREGVPRTLLEAASMAKPIITTDTVGCREVVREGENGYLIPTKDAQALAQKIAYLATHPEVRKIMGENGRIRAIKAFDIKKVLEQYMKLYARLEGKK
jgi:N,N'-diacetylbacillosaminyl-diphospho-undecaprenol alpha-1,3-N-acetylgalactosaminyltransferase